MAVAYCIACERVHVDKDGEVIVYDKDGWGMVTYHRDCTGKAKELTVEGLEARNYLNGVAEKIVEGIREGYGPKVDTPAPIVKKNGRNK